MHAGLSLVFQNLDGHLSDAEVYQHELGLAARAEDVGFDSVWTPEHHFSDYQLTPNVPQFLSWVAGRTSRVKLGTMVTVLPWHDPVRVAEDIAMLDNLLLGRRRVLGFGRGAGRREFDGLRIAMGESRDRFLESLEIVRAALTSERFSFDGKFHKIGPTCLRPRPRSTDLLERKYCAWGSPGTIPIAANAGLAPLFIPQKSWEEIGQEVVQFNQIRAQRGWPAQKPIVVCWVYCSESESEAWESARGFMGNYNDSAVRHYEFDDPDHFDKTRGYEHYATLSRVRLQVSEETQTELFARGQVWGTPSRCLERLREIQRTTGAAELVGVFKYGGMPVEQAERSLRLFAKSVLPEIQKESAAPRR